MCYFMQILRNMSNIYICKLCICYNGKCCIETIIILRAKSIKENNSRLYFSSTKFQLTTLVNQQLKTGLVVSVSEQLILVTT